MRTTDPRFHTLLKETLATPNQTTGDEVVSNSVKTFFKRWPWIYNFLKKLGPAYSPGNHYDLHGRLNEFFGGAVHDKVLLNLGSGTYRIHPEITNVDMFPFKEVDVVADICNTPFKDGTVDGVVCEDVLEHIARAPQLLKEISRVLKPGGLLMLKVPFLYPYHSSPDDFYRWTESGIRYALEKNGFHVKESGAHGGPMGALQGILMHIFAIMFSFGSKRIHFFLVQFFMVVLSPLKLLDLLFLLSPFSLDIASDIYVVAERQN